MRLFAHPCATWKRRVAQAVCWRNRIQRRHMMGCDAEVLPTRSGTYRPQGLNPLGCHRNVWWTDVLQGGALPGDS